MGIRIAKAIAMALAGAYLGSGFSAASYARSSENEALALSAIQVGESHFASNDDFKTIQEAKDPNKAKIKLIRKSPELYSGPHFNLKSGLEAKLRNLPRGKVDAVVLSYASGILRDYHNPKVQRDGNVGDGFTLFLKLLLGQGDLRLNGGEMSIVGNMLSRDDFQENFSHIIDALDIAFPDEKAALKKIKEILPTSKKKIPFLPDFISPAEIHKAADDVSLNIFQNLAYVMVHSKLKDIQKNTPEFASLNFDEEKLKNFILELSSYKQGKQAAAEFPFFTGAKSTNEKKLHGTYSDCMSRAMSLLAKIECLNAFVTAASYPALKMVASEMAEQKFSGFVNSERLPELIDFGVKKALIETHDATEQKQAIVNFAGHLAKGLVSEKIGRVKAALLKPDASSPELIAIREHGVEQLQGALDQVLEESKRKLEAEALGKTVTSFIDSVLVNAHSNKATSPSDEIILGNVENMLREGKGQERLKLFISSLLLSPGSYEDYRKHLSDPGPASSSFMKKLDQSLEAALLKKTVAPQHGEEGLAAYLKRLLSSSPGNPSIVNELVSEISPLITEALSMQFSQIEEGALNEFPAAFRPEVEETLKLIRAAHSIEDFQYEGKTMSCRENNRVMLGVLQKDLKVNDGKSFIESPTQFAAEYVKRQQDNKVMPSLVDCIIMAYARMGTKESVTDPLNKLIAGMSEGGLSGAVRPAFEGLSQSLESENVFHYLHGEGSSAQELRAKLASDLHSVFSKDNSKKDKPSSLKEALHKHVPGLISDALSSSFSTEKFQRGLFEAKDKLNRSNHAADPSNEFFKLRYPNLDPDKFERLFSELRACSEMYTRYYMSHFTPVVEHLSKATLDEMLPLAGATVSSEPMNVLKDFAQSATQTYARQALPEEVQGVAPAKALEFSSLLYELFVYQKKKEKEYEGRQWQSLLDLLEYESDFNQKDHFFAYSDEVRAPFDDKASLLGQKTKGPRLLVPLLHYPSSSVTKMSGIANVVAGLEGENQKEAKAFKAFLNESCKNGDAFMWQEDIAPKQIFEAWRKKRSPDLEEESSVSPAPLNIHK